MELLSGVTSFMKSSFLTAEEPIIGWLLGITEMALYGRFSGFDGDIGDSMHSGTLVSLMLGKHDWMVPFAVLST